MDPYMASNRSCLMVTWIIFKNHLLEIGLTQNHENMALRTLTTIKKYFILSCARRTRMNRNSLKQQLVESPVTYGFTLHEFGGVLGDGLGTLSFGPSQICGRGHGSWLMCKVALNNHGVQCSRLKSSILFKRNSALQNTPLSK